MTNSADPDQLEAKGKTYPSSAGQGLKSTCWCYVAYSELHTLGYPPASVAQLDARLTGDQEVAGFDPRRGWQHSFVEIDHEIFSLPSTDLRRAVVSFWRKNVHNTG